MYLFLNSTRAMSCITFGLECLHKYVCLVDLIYFCFGCRTDWDGWDSYWYSRRICLSLPSLSGIQEVYPVPTFGSTGALAYHPNTYMIGCPPLRLTGEWERQTQGDHEGDKGFKEARYTSLSELDCLEMANCRVQRMVARAGVWKR